jgi:hypothetical protein
MSQYTVVDLVSAVSTFVILYTGDLGSHELKQRVNLNNVPGREPAVNFHNQSS